MMRLLNKQDFGRNFQTLQLLFVMWFLKDFQMQIFVFHDLHLADSFEYLGVVQEINLT